MHLVLLAMMVQPQLQAAVEPPRRVSRAERSRLDLRALDSALAPEARRERSGRRSPQRIQTWRGVPVIMVDGQSHGIW
jgi:hypothetical protein